MSKLYTTSCKPKQYYHSIQARPGFLNWLLAIYLFLVMLLEGTPLFKINSYMAYVLGIFFIVTFRLKRVKRIPEFKLFAFFVMFIWISALLSGTPSSTIQMSVYLTKIYLMAIVALVVVSSLRGLKICLLFALAGSFLLIITVWTGGIDAVIASNSRVTGITSNANTFGGMLSAGVFIGLLLLPIVSKKLKLVIIVYIAMATIGIMASGSRASALAAFLALVFFYWFEFLVRIRSNLKKFLPIIFILILIPYILYLIFPASLLVQRFAEGPEEKSMQNRVELAEFGFKHFLDRPFFGHGAGVFMLYRDYFGHAHSSFIDLLFSMGLAGFFLFYGIFVFLLIRINFLVQMYKNNENYRRFFNAARAVLFAMLIYSLIATSYDDKIYTAILAILAGFTSQFVIDIKKKNQEPVGSTPKT